MLQGLHRAMRLMLPKIGDRLMQSASHAVCPTMHQQPSVSSAGPWQHLLRDLWVPPRALPPNSSRPRPPRPSPSCGRLLLRCSSLLASVRRFFLLPASRSSPGCGCTWPRSLPWYLSFLEPMLLRNRMATLPDLPDLLPVSCGRGGAAWGERRPSGAGCSVCDGRRAAGRGASPDMLLVLQAEGYRDLLLVASCSLDGLCTMSCCAEPLGCMEVCWSRAVTAAASRVASCVGSVKE